MGVVSLGCLRRIPLIALFAAGCLAAGESAPVVFSAAPLPPGFSSLDFAAGQHWARPPENPAAEPGDEARRAYALELDKNYVEAMRAYWHVYIRWPESEAAGIALQRLAHCLFSANDFVRAALVIEKTIAEYPHSADPAALMGIELNLAHQLYASALADARRASEDAAPESPDRRRDERDLLLRSAQWLYQLLYARGDDAPPEVGQAGGLGLGLSCLLLRDFDGARAAWYSVAGEFPDTQAAEMARRLYPVADSLEEQSRSAGSLDFDAMVAAVAAATAPER